MEEKSGTSQIEGGSSSSTVTAIGDGDVLNGTCSTSSSSSVDMPICFLVREQAKSLIAINNLQKRMQHLEGVQDDVISAITEVHDYLSGSPENDRHLLKTSPKGFAPGQSVQKTNVTPGNMSVVSPEKSSCRQSKASVSLSFNELWKNVLPKKSDPECSMRAQSVHQKYLDGVHGKDSAPESDKQDSGLDSDCREHGQESNPLLNALPASLDKRLPVACNDSDELMELLDEIGEKSEILCQHMSSGEENCLQSSHLGMEVSKLHLERLGLHDLLSDIKGERDHLKSRVEDLETTTNELASEKKHLEQRFATTLVEKHKLEARFHGFEPVHSKSTNLTSDSSASGDSKCGVKSTVDSPSSARRQAFKVNSDDVSAVLKETNALDLQKQLLTYMMENKVLHAKLEQVEQLLSLKDVERDCQEKMHREEIRQHLFEYEQLQVAFEEQKMEAVSLKSKARILERVLQSVTVENRELNGLLGESIYLREALQKSRPSLLRPSTSSVRRSPVRYSLPAQNGNEQNISVSCAKSKLLPNASSFLDLTIEDPDASDSDLAFTIGPFGFSQGKASTPLVPSKKQDKSNFLDLARPSQPVINVSSSGRPNPPVYRKSGQKLTFNSVKPISHSANFSLSDGDFAKTKLLHSTAEACDKVTRTRSSMLKPPDLIQDNSVGDHKKFPFYTILEKLKSSSEYKLPSRSPVHEEDEEGHQLDNISVKAGSSDGSSVRNISCKKPVLDHKCSTITNSPQETGQGQKDRKNNTKSIHKRIQNILERITAESDEAVV